MTKISLTFIVMAMVLAPFASAADPYAKPDDSWIRISGTVTSTNPDSFRLDYGTGIITVEMDDWDMDADGYKLIPGDRVTVNGYVDDDLYEMRTIEAGSVYVEGLNTYFYASSADEEDALYPYWTSTEPVVLGNVTLTGTVTSVNGREFTIDSGRTRITVDTIEMPYNPMDDEGYQKIEEGDRVSVTGDIEENLFDELELTADVILTLDDANS